MSNNQLTSLIQDVISQYYCFFPNQPQIPIELFITQCLSETHSQLRPDLKDKLVEQEIEKVDDHNGRMVLPRKIGDNIYILINYNKMIEYSQNDNLTWVGTIAHELTHAIDYYFMCQKNGLKTYDPLMESEYSAFQYWSEFHARKLGYTFLNHMLNDTDDSYGRLNHVLEHELPFHRDRHWEEYHSAKDANQQIYVTMQYLSRISVWSELFPDTFNEQFLNQIFLDSSWLYDLFHFLHNHSSFQKIYSNLDQFELCLRANWECI